MKKSTGPTSPQGKAQSSQNSTAHGMRSIVVRLLAGESQDEMDAMRAMWESQYGRYTEGNPAMALLLFTLGDADWMQRRTTRFVCEVMTRLLEAEAGGEDEERIAKLEKKLTLWTRYKTSAENSFQRALRAVEHFLARRRRESIQQQRLVVKAREVADKIGSKRLKEGRFERVDAIEAKPEGPVKEQPDSGGGGHEQRV
jgi:hypothetical protein